MDGKRYGIVGRGLAKKHKQSRAARKVVLAMQTSLKGSQPIATMPEGRLRRQPALVLNGQTVRPAKESLISPRLVADLAHAKRIADAEIAKVTTTTARVVAQYGYLDWTDANNITEVVTKTIYATCESPQLDLDWQVAVTHKRIAAMLSNAVGAPVSYWRQCCRYLLTAMRQSSEYVGHVESLEALAEKATEDGYDGLDYLGLSEIPSMSAKRSIGPSVWAEIIDGLERLPSGHALHCIKQAMLDVPASKAQMMLRQRGGYRPARPLAQPVMQALMDLLL